MPVFVKSGAIIPRCAENNNPQPISITNPDGLDRTQRIMEFFAYGETSFNQYEDDGITLDGGSATTKFISKVEGTTVILTAKKIVESYEGMVKNRSTEFVVYVSQEPTKVDGYTKVTSKEVYKSATGKIYFYDENPSIFIKNYATKGTTYANTLETTKPILYIKDSTKSDITANAFKVVISGFENTDDISIYEENNDLAVPTVFQEEVVPTTVTLSWDAVTNADYYEIEFVAPSGEDLLLGSIRNTTYVHDNLLQNIYTVFVQ